MFVYNADVRNETEAPSSGGLHGPARRGGMSKEEMKQYIMEKLETADYLETETIYGLILGLMG